MSRKRVVLVCMVDSIHVARWIAQFDASEVEFTLFPSTPNRRVHAMIKDLLAKNGNIKIVPFGGKLSIPLWGMDLIFSDYVRGFLLRRILKRDQPDFVHALELQHGGYIASRALEVNSLKTPFIATNYGSDIYWFQQFPRHLSKIKRLLARADRYSAECHRDVDLAKKYGFTGEVMPVFPNAGGFTDEQLARPTIPVAERNTIAVKGYESWAGLASVALEAIRSQREVLEGFEIVVFSASRGIRKLAKEIACETGLNIRTLKKGSLSHEAILEVLQRSRCYVGISRTDGLSTSALEAMAMGAFPIQSDTSCIEEWHHGVSGIVVSSPDPLRVGADIKRTILEDDLVAQAQLVNRDIVRSMLSSKVAKKQIEGFYVT